MIWNLFAAIVAVLQKASIADLSQENKSYLSNPWEAEPDPRRARKGSISGLDDPNLRSRSHYDMFILMSSAYSIFEICLAAGRCPERFL